MSEESQIVPRGEGQLSLASADPESMMRFALEKGASVEVMSQMLTLHERLSATRAKEAFTLALADFQSECPIIKKVAFGAKNAYKFAPLDYIVVQVRDLIKKHGFTYTLTAAVTGDRVKAMCKITPRMGHSDQSEFECPVDNNRANIMTEPQRFGAAMTFAKRYAFTNAFGILTGDEDTDGRARQRPTFGPQGGQGGHGPQTPDPTPRQEAQPRAATPPPAARTAPAATTTPPAPASSPAIGALKRDILAAAKPKFPFPAADVSNSWEFQEFTNWLYDEGIVMDTEQFTNLPEARLRQVLAAIKERIQ